jgi:glycosyltransferase involved in cell wall biosynthesis
VDGLRRSGQQVTTGDVDLYGGSRLLAAAVTFVPRMRRWRKRFRLAGFPFRLRSRRAGRHITALSRRPDIILQIGATFEPLERGSVPYAVITDSNILLSRHGASTAHSEAAELSPRDLGAIAARESRVYHDACAIFTMSERTRRSFIEDFGIPSDRVRTIFAGPNFDPDAIEPPERLPGRPPTVLFVGRDFARKGGDALLTAFRRVRQEIPNAELIIVGPDQLPSVEPGVSFLGFLDKTTPAGWRALMDTYGRADVFCLPTRFEAFGIAYVEAMCFGLPCIGTSVWAVPEIIADGVTGYVVPPNDIAALAERLLLLLRDPVLAQKMGTAGRDRAAQLFAWPRVADRIVETLEPLVARGSAPR